MKLPIYTILAITTMLAVGCNKQKAEIDHQTDATLDAIDTRKDEISADAKLAKQQADANALIDKARIEAENVAAQARLDADKKRAEAEAEAAKVRIDTENR